LNNWERDLRDAERNQELRRQNNLLEQQRWEQQESNQKQHAALQEQNRLAWKQNEALEKRNELERQRQWDEKFRHERELELRKEQQYKDNIFDLKKLWAKAETEDERGRIQILLAEAETEYNQYLFEKEREKEQEELARHHREKINRIKWFFGIAISLLLLVIIGTFFIGMSKSKSSHNSTKQSTQSSNSATSTSSTKQASLGGNKSKDKQTSSTTSASSRPQATKVYIGNLIGLSKSEAISELKSRKITENHIKVEEEESDEYSPGTILRQSLSEGTLYDLNDSSDIILTVAKERTSATMPNYAGSSFEFAKNNLINIVGIKEANIERVEVSTAPEGTSEGTVVDQHPKVGEEVDLKRTRVKISIYKPKAHQTSQSRSR
jgi:non-specific serine/threonine protein kinase